jgi:hypothetical protein
LHYFPFAHFLLLSSISCHILCIKPGSAHNPHRGIASDNSSLLLADHLQLIPVSWNNPPFCLLIIRLIMGIFQ